MQATHFGCQRWLVTYRGRHTSQEGGYFGTRLSKAEDVVDKEKHVFTFLVTEIFRHRQAGQRYAKTGTRRLVHLTEYHRGFVDNAGIAHLVVKVITFTSTLTYAGKYGDTAVFLSDVVDQFLDRNGFTYTRTAEETDFTAFWYGASKSITLIPVSSISACVESSSYAGASRWIGLLTSDTTSPALSIGSPKTLNTRPSVAEPTGTVIGLPKSTASIPRTRPSVDDIAIQRTRLSPK